MLWCKRDTIRFVLYNGGIKSVRRGELDVGCGINVAARFPLAELTARVNGPS